ncbi:MAG: HNH endonuclease signature motif containing protein [Egibacteraceae bacterium]
MAVRDRGCVGCRAPIPWCEGHHVVHWIDHGPTDLDNLVLLCARCHHNVHERGWRLARGPDHRWRLHPPHRR